MDAEFGRAWLAVLPYAGLTLAAIVEGEVAYIAAATLVAEGHLYPLGVLLAGALGASIGDQTYFYIFRGRLPRWMARVPSLYQPRARSLPADPVAGHAAADAPSGRARPGARSSTAR